MRDYAAFTFEPWEHDQPGYSPTAEKMDELGVSARLAYCMMLKSKEELVESYKRMNSAEADMLLRILNDAAEGMKALAEMVEAAHGRFLAAASAHELKAGRRASRAAAA